MKGQSRCISHREPEQLKTGGKVAGRSHPGAVDEQCVCAGKSNAFPALAGREGRKAKSGWYHGKTSSRPSNRAGTFIFWIFNDAKGEVSMNNNTLELKQELLRLLDQDYHQTHEQLARQLGAETSQVAKMIRELEDDRILVKCQPIINWEKAGLEDVSALIEVKITPQREVGFDAIAARIYRFPEVRNLFLMSGTYDLAVTVEGANLKEVAQFVSTKLATIDGVVSTTTHFVLKKYKEEGVIIDDEEADRRLLVTP